MKVGTGFTVNKDEIERMAIHGTSEVPEMVVTVAFYPLEDWERSAVRWRWYAQEGTPWGCGNEDCWQALASIVGADGVAGVGNCLANYRKSMAGDRKDMDAMDFPEAFRIEPLPKVEVAVGSDV